MKHIFLFLLLLFFSSSSAFAAEKPATHRMTPPLPAAQYKTGYTPSPVGLEKFALGIDGNKRVFYSYTPRSLKPSAPAVLLLHEAGRNGIAMADMWRKNAERHGLLLIAPDAAGGDWDYAAEKAFLTALVHFLKQDKRVDPARLYLFGHAGGAKTALPLGAALSEHFAAFSVHAGMVTEKGLLPVINGAKRKIPVCVINGSADKTVPAIRANYAAQLFATAGHPAAYIELTGHTHWYYSLGDWINELAWQCMLDLGKKR